MVGAMRAPGDLGVRISPLSPLVICAWAPVSTAPPAAASLIRAGSPPETRTGTNVGVGVGVEDEDEEADVEVDVLEEAEGIVVGRSCVGLCRDSSKSPSPTLMTCSASISPASR